MMKKMYNYDAKNKFVLFNQSSHYLRVDEKHPLELLIGLNDKGQKTLRFLGEFKRTQVKSTKSIEVNHYKINDKYAINFSLEDNQYEDLFYIFCNDMIDSSRYTTIDKGYSFLVNRYEKWKGFSNTTRKFLSEFEIKGLLGELFFMKNHLFKLYGVSKTISGWTGTEPTKKDFSYDDVWFEIKTVSKDTIYISSLEQLESNNIGYLVVYSIEKLSPEANEVSLNKLANEILSIVENANDLSQLMLKFAEIGYYMEDYYDSYVYRFASTNYYEVNQNFPKIDKQSLPSAISNVKYEIIISMLDAFKRSQL